MSTVAPSSARTRRRPRVAAWAVAHAALWLAAVALWIVALRGTDLDRMQGLGLIDAFPPAYYAAVLLIVTGCLAALLARRVRAGVFATHLATLIVMFHGSAALLYEEPRYPWVYKHLGVIDYIRVNGAVDRTLDIYNNWPGLFALTGMLSDVSGVPPAQIAPWAQVFFSGLTALAALYAISPLVDDRRQRLLSVLIVVLGDWVGQNYLAPQALAFPLMLVAIGLWLRVAPEAPRGRMGRAFARLRRGLHRAARFLVRGRAPLPGPDAEVPSPPVPYLARRSAGLLAAPVVLAIVLTHQLTPIVLIMSTLMLAATTGRRLGRPLATMIGLQVVWLALAWPYLSERISLVQFGGVPRPEIPVTTTPLPNAMLTARAAQVCVLLVVLLALAGLVRRLRGGRPVGAAVTLVMAPLLLVPVQSYGGEAGLRAYLFALPWLAILASDAVLGIAGMGAGRRRIRRRALRRARLATGRVAVGGLTVVVLLCSLVAYFGAELASRVGPEDVAASTWYEDNAPAGSILSYLSPGFPNRINARYAHKEVPAGSFSPSLVDDPYTRYRLLDDDTRMDAVIGVMEALPLTDRFLVIGPSQIRTLTLFGVLPDDVLRRLPDELRASPAFRVVYDRDGATIFEYLGSGPA